VKIVVTDLPEKGNVGSTADAAGRAARATTQGACMRCALVALTIASLLGQPAISPPSTFHVSTRLIQVNVIVHDRKGEPITGLNKDQFTIFDQGVAQKIVFFSEHSLGASAAAPASTPRGGASSSALVFSNRPDETNAPAGSVTAVLFDSLNTDFLDSGFARARVEKFLKGIQPEDRVALYGLSTKLLVLHDFTGDADALVQALDRFKADENSETSATKFKESHVGQVDGMINDMNQRMSDLFLGARVQATAAALEAIAKHLTGLAGRKNLVWVSGSFPMNIGTFQRRLPGTRPGKEDFSKEVEAAARALSGANIAIYPVDARGLTTLGGVFNAATTPIMTAGQLQSRAGRSPDLAPIRDVGTMQALADATGGRVFENTNDIEGAVRSAIDDSRSTYVLGYYPDHNQWDGKFREIKVQVKRAGLETRYRRGYMAFPDAPLDEKRPTLTAADAAAGPLESTELGLSLQVEPVVGPNGARQIKARLRFDAVGMGFDQKDGKWLDDLDVLWVQLDAKGELVVSNGQTLTLKLSPETYQSAVGNGVRMTTTETIAEPTAEIRFLARDRGTGARGSVRIAVAKVFGK
jgi:VWFA-related protein